jgi:protein involved in polysaccharide export with SLBB domain
LLRHSVFVLGLIFMPPAAMLLGQTRATAPAGAVDEKELAKYLQKENEQSLPPQAIEGAIDPATYLVGPGDVLTINAWGLSSEADLGLSLKVTPEGKIIIPSVGIIAANDKTLRQVQEEVRQACAAKYDPNKVKITAHLTQLRLVRAHIYGEVKSPGIYVGTAIDRIAYYISEAEGWTAWADERQVQVRHLDGTVDTLDLSRLYQGGELAQNIYISAGDVIYFPRIELTDRVVYVEGEVPLPGPNKIAQDETALDFLHRIEAMNRKSDLNEIYLVRGHAAPARLTFFGNGVEGLEASATPLQHGDRILVPALKEYVYVRGAVHSPGRYPYVVGYKAADYVGLAGATVESASLKSVKVIHGNTGITEKGPERDVERGDTIVVSASIRSKFSQYLTITSQVATLVIAAAAIGTIGNSK